MKRAMFILIISFIAVKSWSQNAVSYQSLVIDSVSSKTLETNSVYDLRKNSIYMEIGGKGILASVNYDRILPLNDKSGIILGCAVGFLGDFIPEINYLYGKSKNFFEIGLGYSFPEQLLVPQIGYRYQGEKGFLFRAGGMYFQSTQPDSFGDFPWFGLSFGYSF